jgi:hypothetical protein
MPLRHAEKAAAASAAFKYIVNDHVLVQDDESLLMKVLEQSGITDNHKLFVQSMKRPVKKSNS